MNKIDIIAIIILVLYAYRGYKKGLLYGLLVSTRFILSIIVSHFLLKIYSDKLLQDARIIELIEKAKFYILQKLLKSHPILSLPVSNIDFGENFDYYILFFILILFTMSLSLLLFKLLRITVRKGLVKSFDKFLGALFSGGQFLLIFMLIVFIFDKIPDHLISIEIKENLSQSIFLKYGYIYNVFTYFLG